MERKFTVPSRLRDLFVFIGIAVIYELIFLNIAIYPDFDWFSYHFHNGWAFLNGRFNIDMLASLHRTCFNPVLDSIQYCLFHGLNSHPKLFLFIENLRMVFYFFMSYKIMNLVLVKGKDYIWNIIFCFGLLILSPIFFSMMNFDNTDVYISDIILVAYYIFLKSIKNKNYSFLNALVIGVLCGGAVGLKYTAVAYAISLLLVSGIAHRTLKLPLKYILQIFVMMFGGFMVTDGWWLYIVWKKFGNPMFPYFNNIFKSQYAPQSSLLRMDMYEVTPKSFVDFLFFPLRDSSIKKIGWERLYFDFKFPATFFSAVILIVVQKFVSIREKLDRVIDFDLVNLSLFYVIFVYYINLAIYGNIRYISAVLPLCSIIIFSVICLFAQKVSYKKILVVIFLLALFMTQYKRDSFVNISKVKLNQIVSAETVDLVDNSIVLCGSYASAFLIPFYKYNASFVGYPFQEDLLKNYNYSFNSHGRGIIEYYVASKAYEDYVAQRVQKSKDVYMLLYRNMSFENVIEMYDESVKRYFDDGKTHFSIDDCDLKHFKIFNIVSDYFICKLK